MNASGLRFKPRVFLIVTVSIAVVFVAIVTIPQWFSKQARLQVLRSHVAQIAQLAGSAVDGDLHEQLLDPARFTPELYARALAPLVRFHCASPDIFYVYTMTVRSGKTFFVLDTATSSTLLRAQHRRSSAYMEPFKLRREYESDWLAQLAAGKTWVTPAFQQDDYGNFLTGHAPIFDGKGRYAGFVGVDFNLQYYLAQEARFNKIVIGSLVGALLMSILIGYVVARYQFDLYDQMQRHYRFSMHDELTALCNRRGALAAVSTALRDRPATTHATLLVDIDNFKTINDTFGHAAGDATIAKVAAAIRVCIRAGDISARLGGDEFMVFAPDCNLDRAKEIAERLLNAIRNGDKRPATFTVSIGISVERHLNADFDAMYRRADTALYRAKSDGKNCFAVCVNAVASYSAVG
jgi:diguanylate cyclase (GGDEF)-like protein